MGQLVFIKSNGGSGAQTGVTLQAAYDGYSRIELNDGDRGIVVDARSSGGSAALHIDNGGVNDVHLLDLMKIDGDKAPVAIGFRDGNMPGIDMLTVSGAYRGATAMLVRVAEPDNYVENIDSLPSTKYRTNGIRWNYGGQIDEVNRMPFTIAPEDGAESDVVIHGANRSGGSVSVLAGNSRNYHPGKGGDLLLGAGNGGLSGDGEEGGLGGNVQLAAGRGGFGAGGYVAISAGNSTGGADGGSVHVNTGAGIAPGSLNVNLGNGGGGATYAGDTNILSLRTHYNGYGSLQLHNTTSDPGSVADGLIHHRAPIESDASDPVRRHGIRAARNGAYGLVARGYQQTVRDSDVSNGELDIVHNLDTRAPIVQVYDGTGRLMAGAHELAASLLILTVDANTIRLQMEPSIPEGDQWHVTILGF
jgi:hypothetical protein